MHSSQQLTPPSIANRRKRIDQITLPQGDQHQPNSIQQEHHDMPDQIQQPPPQTNV